METEPYAINPHQLSINDAITSASPSWLHFDAIALSLDGRSSRSSVRLSHDGESSILIEAVTIRTQVSVRARVEEASTSSMASDGPRG